MNCTDESPVSDYFVQSLFQRNCIFRGRNGNPRHQCRNDLQRGTRRRQAMQEPQILRASDWDKCMYLTTILTPCNDSY
jgi:hypothetical protein